MDPKPPSEAMVDEDEEEEEEEEEEIPIASNATPQTMVNNIRESRRREEKDEMNISEAIQKCKNVRRTNQLRFQPHSLLPMAKRGIKSQYRELISQAFSFFIDKKFDEAIPIYLEAIRKNPNDDVPYIQLGIIYEDQGKFQQSLECRLIGAMLKGKAENFKACYEFAMKHQYWESAKYCLNRLIRKMPNEKILIISRADLLVNKFLPKAEKRTDRLAILRDIVKSLKECLKKKEDVEVMKKLAEVYVRGYGDFEKAMPFIEKALKIHFKEFDKQQKNIQQQQQIFFDYGLLNELNETYMHTKKFKKCVDVIRESAKITNQNLDSYPIEILTNYAISLIALSQAHDAKLVVDSLFKRCQGGSTDPSSPDAVSFIDNEENVISYSDFFLEISEAYYKKKDISSSTKILTQLWNAYNEIRNVPLEDEDEDEEEEEEEDGEDVNMEGRSRRNQMSESELALHNQRVVIASCLGRNTFESEEYENSLKYYKVLLKDRLSSQKTARGREREILEKEIVDIRLKISNIYQNLGQSDQALRILPQQVASRPQHYRRPLPPFPSGPAVSHRHSPPKEGGLNQQHQQRIRGRQQQQQRRRKRIGGDDYHQSNRLQPLRVDHQIKTTFQQCKVLESQGDTQMFLQTAQPFIDSILHLSEELGKKKKKRGGVGKRKKEISQRMSPTVVVVGGGESERSMDTSPDEQVVSEVQQQQQQQQRQVVWSFFRCQKIIGEPIWSQFTFTLLDQLSIARQFEIIYEITKHCLPHTTKIFQYLRNEGSVPRKRRGRGRRKKKKKKKKKMTDEDDFLNDDDDEEEEEEEEDQEDAAEQRKLQERRRKRKRNEYSRKMSLYAISSSCNIMKYDEAMKHIRELLRERKRILDRLEQQQQQQQGEGQDEYEDVDKIIDPVFLWNQYCLIKARDSSSDYSFQDTSNVANVAKKKKLFLKKRSSRSTVRRFLTAMDDYPSNLMLANFHLSVGSEGHAIPIYRKLMERYTHEYDDVKTPNFELQKEYKKIEDPTLFLAAGAAYLNGFQKKMVESKEWMILQAFVFFSRYEEICKDEQEKNYNMGRVYHQLGMWRQAIILYEKVLASEDRVLEPGSEETWEVRVDLKRESAYNLSKIYKETGNISMERKVLMEHLIID